ncbi:ATP-binding cassette domain-containing protein [Dongia sp.]|uniref:ABC transporter ATP-binding protein n=1 Tax=Dongia sp. TaxID=1977262 RepID=UPI0035AFB24A
MISLRNLSMHFKVHVKEAGFLGSLRSLVRRQYREIVAVDGISFDIPDGEVVGFLGPNGAGKTTTLKMMSGLLHPSAGTVTVNGHTPHKRDNSFLQSITLVMGQKQQLLWDLPASDSFLVNQAYYGIGDADYRRRLGELVELLALKHIIDKPMRTLSLGERMKCELAAALLHQPKILFLDEPTIGLDITMQQNVRDFIRDYNRLHKATVVLTSHYMGDIAALVSRVIVIDQGRVVFDGSLRDLTQRMVDRKILKLHFATPVTRQALERFGLVERLDGHAATLRVERGAVPQVAGAILANFPVEDIAIEDIPIEDVLRSLFAGSGAPS